ncbi:MAG TPA: hypothetical protein VFK05_39555 [Polyangiaceae bacterium]|nr:hypothetical protein [Polyangiaceae bacterium]
MTQEDEKQLRLLSTLHYVGAALACSIPLLGGFYAAFGVSIVLGRWPGQAPSPGDPFGWAPVAMGSLMMLFGLISVTLNLVSARSLRARKHHTLCLLTSGLNCIHLPLGTLLGVFTIVVLCRPAVSAAFRSGAVPPAGAGPFAPSTPPPPPSARSAGAHS